MNETEPYSSRLKTWLTVDQCTTPEPYRSNMLKLIAEVEAARVRILELEAKDAASERFCKEMLLRCADAIRFQNSESPDIGSGATRGSGESAPEISPADSVDLASARADGAVLISQMVQAFARLVQDRARELTCDVSNLLPTYHDAMQKLKAENANLQKQIPNRVIG